MSLRTEKLLKRHIQRVIQDRRTFLAGTAIPTINTGGVQTGSIVVQRIYDDGTEDLRRAEGQPHYTMGQRPDEATVTYACEDAGAAEALDKREAQRLSADALLNRGLERVAKATLRTLVYDENEMFSLLLATAGGGGGTDDFTDQVGAVDFTQFNQANSDPFVAFNDVMDAIELDAGLRPNTIIFGGVSVYNSVAQHSTLLASLPANVDQSIAGFSDLKARLAYKLGIERVEVIRSARKSTRNPADRTKMRVGADLDNILLAYLPETLSTAQSKQTTLTDATAAARIVEFERDFMWTQDGFTQIYDVGYSRCFRILVPELGIRLTDVLA